MDNPTEGDGPTTGPTGHVVDGRSSGHLEIDEKRKELEVAEIMCGIQQKNNHSKTGDDVQVSNGIKIGLYIGIFKHQDRK